jgi:hypothetical protein
VDSTRPRMTTMATPIITTRANLVPGSIGAP